MRKHGVIVLLLVMVLITACTTQGTTPSTEPTTALTDPPIPTEAPICDAAAAGASQVLLSQDFSDPTKGWVEILEENEDIYVHARTEDGVYKFTGRWFASKGLGQTFPQDIIFEMDIQFAGEIEKTDNQIIQQQLNFEYRNSPDQEVNGDFFYNFIITGEGFFWFEKTTWESDDGVLLTNRVRLTEPQQIPDFKPEEMNRLKLVIVGDDTTFYMNDQVITTVTDPFTAPYDEYDIYFTTIPYFFNGLNPSETLYEIYVDNVCIYAL